MLEKFQDFVARCNCRLTRLVDQVSGHHAMRGRDIALEQWRKIGIRRAVRKYPPNKAITKRLVVG